MASGTSCFNSALYRKTLTRFWPLWTLWGVLWLLLLPLSQLSRYFDWVREGRSDSALVENFQEILSLQEVGVWLAALVGVLAAMAVFSYLYSARSACMMHALPLRREGLFLSQYLAGLTMLVLPLAAVALVTLAVGMAVISPMPMAPQATSSPGFSTTMALISGTWLALKRPRVPNLAVGRQFSRGYCSVRAKPMDMTTPPSIWPSQDTGFTALPTSWAATIFSILPSSPSTHSWVA